MLCTDKTPREDGGTCPAVYRYLLQQQTGCIIEERSHLDMYTQCKVTSQTPKGEHGPLIDVMTMDKIEGVKESG